MALHPLDLSDQILDSGTVVAPPNRITQELSELADGVALVESFSHVVLVDSGDGLLAFDTSGAGTGGAVVDAMRSWSDRPLHTIVYTHGHMDHVGGSRAFAADAEDRGNPLPRVFGHGKVNARLDRYAATDGYNQAINLRQFGGVTRTDVGQLGIGSGRTFIPPGTLRVDTEYDGSHIENIGGVDLEYHHALGETDDHTWTWLPDHKMISAGDLFIWNFPNCGNPQKVQRYPAEWAVALREMSTKGAELFVPAHGLPIRGADRIITVLDTVATTLENLVRDVVDAMNSAATLDDIVNSVSVPKEILELPYLRPLYDEPEFAIRGIWRLYGGWWDGNAARLKPASDAAIGAEVCRLAGGVDAVTSRAIDLAGRGYLRLACQLIEYAVAADPESAAVHAARVEIYTLRRASETSLMAKGVFAAAKAESQLVLGDQPERTRLNDSIDGSLGQA